MRTGLAMLLIPTLITAGAMHVAADTPGFGLTEPIPSEAYNVETVVNGLNTPWDISWLPNGDMLVTERDGALRVVRDGQLMDAPVDGVPSVYANSQAGLFEAMPHPDFAKNNWLYFTYAYGEAKENTLRLARARYIETEDSARLEDLEVVFEAKAVRPTSAHYGGRFVFLDDGTILLTSGDAYAFRHEAQKLDNHFGKILRLTDEGEAAPDNPFTDTPDALPEIWSYGHRNQQGIAVGSDGTIYSNEHGARGGDEINIIEAGENYGWPLATWGVDYSGSQISPYGEVEGTKQPILYWTPSIAPGALLYYDGDQFPNWRGLLFSSGLATQEVRVVDPAKPAADQYSLLAGQGMRVRDVTMGPDGYIYVSIEAGEEGEILRLTPNE